jgi:hypothetical protein
MGEPNFHCKCVNIGLVPCAEQCHVCLAEEKAIEADKQ